MPIYTYECPQGHRWDEVRSLKGEGLEVSEDCCAACGPDETGVGTGGRRVPSTASVRIPGGTPTHYPNMKENK